MQPALRRRVALKVLPRSAASDAKQLGRFKNEAQAAAQVQHPNIVPVYAVGEDAGVHYFAMQLIEGASLATAIGAAATAGDTPQGEATTLGRESRTWADTRTKPAVLASTIGVEGGGGVRGEASNVSGSGEAWSMPSALAALMRRPIARRS